MELAMLARWSEERLASESRTSCACTPRAANSRRKRLAIAKLMSFSRVLGPRSAPDSAPPCAASIMMAGGRGDGGAGTAIGGFDCGGEEVEVWADKHKARSKTTDNARKARHFGVEARLIQRIDCQAAQQFGIEVGRFLRQHFAGERDVADLSHASG